MSHNLFNWSYIAYGDAAMWLKCVYMALKKCDIYTKFCNKRDPC